MLSIRHKDLADETLEVLRHLQQEIDGEANYEAQVTKADVLWRARNSTKQSRAAFKVVRETLAEMCIGPVRCAYCEDSLADEVEHIRPKSLFPSLTFVWTNHCFACGPCNGPKRNRYGTIHAGRLIEFFRKRNAAVLPPPAGVSALIDPRTEDPTEFLELDLGGQLPNGELLDGTFEFLPRESIPEDKRLKAVFTIDVLGLNREVIRASRENAFGGFRARLTEYAVAFESGATEAQLDALKSDLLSTPHLTVFHEMRRQQEYLPEIRALFERAPVALDWPLTAP
ncbi:uncharacterized protein (TIGR02646 family) [Pseudacidovorax intermedius]|uniref:Uncharacterized protein (TIGR02646 family) n=1 Tax=Pseudacidovorax intermedius TaxID=433924 RepID=A0A370F7Q1_9BURK|nr:hypothetical protein [Pseudacidovorax intermedius]RDI18591.1 uncharacterized protein (TIGR02646 family) [Pseudacidovorax intermedius]